MPKKISFTLPKTKRSVTSGLAPRHSEIAFRAYEIFLGRGATHGHDLDDWLQAELELIAKATGEGAALSTQAPFRLKRNRAA